MVENAGLADRPQITARCEGRGHSPKVAVVHGLARGGAHRRLAEQITELGSAVQEFCPSTATPVTDTPTVVACPLLAERVPTVLRPPLRYLDLVGIERAWRGVSRAVERAAPDAVFANPCRLVQSPPLRLAARVPVVYFRDEPRRIDYEPTLAATRRRSTRTLYGPLYRAERRLDARGAGRADLILTNSRYTADRIERAYGGTAWVIPLGVSQALLDAGHGQPPEASWTRGYVLSVGALLQGKGHDLALRAAAAAALAPDVVIVTPRRDEVAADVLLRLAGSLGVALAVRTEISDVDLAKAYTGAIALLYLGHNEPFGLASIEAQARGCPAIVADEGGLPETVVDGVTGRVVPRAAESAAEAIDQIAGDRERVAMEARRHGRSLTWQASGAAVRAAIDELVAAR
jgi:glycosyltransferase involved in cell wall biosynthesis